MYAKCEQTPAATSKTNAKCRPDEPQNHEFQGAAVARRRRPQYNVYVYMHCVHNLDVDACVSMYIDSC